MAEIKLKAVMYEGAFIEAGLLDSGIHEAERLTLYPNNYTMKDIEGHAMRMREEFLMTAMYTDTYLNNLRKCELVDVVVKTIDEPTESVQNGD